MLDAIGQYRILEWVGAGGLGETCRARDTRLGRTVALTIVSDEIVNSPDRRSRFIEDARRAAALSHPNIAALYEVGEEDGLVFLAKEFVPGQSLASIIGSHALNTRRAIDYATQIADALADAHAAGTAHGGLKAERIIITPKGNAKIPDFGFASWLGKDNTPDEAGDLRALGVVLFHMLTGKPPVPGWPAPAPSTINRSLPREIDAIAGKLLSTEASTGYESAASVAAELRSMSALLDVGAKTVTAQPVMHPRAPEPARRGWIFAVVTVALVVVAALIWAATRP
jgi:serine/threonine-protein kinase